MDIYYNKYNSISSNSSMKQLLKNEFFSRKRQSNTRFKIGTAWFAAWRVTRLIINESNSGSNCSMKFLEIEKFHLANGNRTFPNLKFGTVRFAVWRHAMRSNGRCWRFGSRRGVTFAICACTPCPCRVFTASCAACTDSKSTKP